MEIVNEADYLTDKYKGKTFKEIAINFDHSHYMSHTVTYNTLHYIIVCDRFDVCTKVLLLMDQ